VNSIKSVVKFNKRKGIAGIIIALLFLAVSFTWFDRQTGFKFALMFVVVGLLEFDFKFDIINIAANFIWAMGVIVATWYISYTSTCTLSDISKSDEKMLLNSLCIAAVCMFIMAIANNWKFSISCASALLCLLATASGFLNQFRGKELSPVDFLSWSTALNVADKYTPKVHAEMFFGWMLCALLIFASLSLPTMPKLHRVWTRVVALFSSVVLLGLMFHGARDVKIQSWGDFGARFNGYYLNFALGIRDLSFNKPEQYSIRTVNQLESEYTADAGNDAKLPNIIVIMDEAYADFRVYENAPMTNIPVTPFIDSLNDNTVRGFALASVFGGNTANSEFEFLTGCSLAFLPQNAIPYQQYIKGELHTLAWFLNKKGYISTATHPCPAGNWSRGRIYPYFGFENNTFEDSYPDGGLVREYVGDNAVFEHILEKLYANDSGKPMFEFAVTMQNHSSYNYSGDNYIKTVDLEGYDREYPAAEQYLSLLNETDKAMERFITSLQEYKEDTIVLVFGDHQPSVESEFYEKLNGGAIDNLSEQMLKYTVPFFIWANFDIEEDYIDCTALNYLPLHLLEAANIGFSPYYKFLSDIQSVVPAVNSLGYYSKENGVFKTLEEAKNDEADALSKYSVMQYNNLFDTKNRSDFFFDSYIEFR